MKKNTEGSKKIADAVNRMIPIVLIAIMLVSGIKTVLAFISYRTANDEYDKLEGYVEAVTTEATPQSSQEAEEETVSEYVKSHDIDRVICIYNIDFVNTDSNFGYLE